MQIEGEKNFAKAGDLEYPEVVGLLHLQRSIGDHVDFSGAEESNSFLWIGNKQERDARKFGRFAIVLVGALQPNGSNLSIPGNKLVRPCSNRVLFQDIHSIALGVFFRDDGEPGEPVQENRVRTAGPDYDTREGRRLDALNRFQLASP